MKTIWQQRVTFAAYALPFLLLAAQAGACGAAAGDNANRAQSTSAKSSAANTANASNASNVANASIAANVANASNVANHGASATTPSNVSVRGGSAATGAKTSAREGDEQTGDATMSDAQQSEPAEGAWGGAGIRLIAKGDEYEVEFDCAHGRFGKIEPDSDGDFSVCGTFVRERGGPVSSNDVPQSFPACYKGKISGDRMTLRVSIEDIGDLDYTLERGKWGRLRKCL
jgi:hypothetical protein